MVSSLLVVFVTDGGWGVSTTPAVPIDQSIERAKLRPEALAAEIAVKTQGFRSSKPLPSKAKSPW